MLPAGRQTNTLEVIVGATMTRERAVTVSLRLYLRTPNRNSVCILTRAATDPVFRGIYKQVTSFVYHAKSLCALKIQHPRFGTTKMCFAV